MKPFILKIKQPGLSMKIPGMKAFRTPGEVVITEKNLREVLIYLAALDITDFEILPYRDDEKPKPRVVRKESAKQSERIEDKLDRIANMLEKLLVETGELPRLSQPQEFHEDPEVEPLDSFIPEVSVDNMKLSGLKKQTFEKQDIEDSVDKLSKLNKKVDGG